MLGEIFQNEYRILWATSGKKALQIVRSKIPDLILLDIMMPGMDGYKVCEQLRKDPYTKAIPVIFVTALEQAQYEMTGLESGAIDYLTKPINPGIAKLRVRNHLQLKQTRDQLERLADTDGLTGIPNRRYFDQHMTQEWYRALRKQSFLSLLIADIDFFKAFNDHYGHLAGDECLKRIAKTLSENLVRATDMVARYGGEEFVCLLPDTDQNGLYILCEKLHHAVSVLEISHPDSKVADHVTLSLGGATIVPDSGRNPEELLKIADQNLYKAKKEGRNRFII